MGAFESVEGLVQALPEEHRADAQAYLARYADEAKAGASGQANATAAELRKARSELMELRGLKSTYEADLAIAREQAETAKGAGTERDTVKAERDALKAERDRLAGFRERYAAARFADLVAESGGIADRDYVPAIIGRLGLAPKVDDDGTVSLDEASAARLKAFMDIPDHAAKYAGRQGRYQRPGPPAKETSSRVESVRARIAAAKTPEQRTALQRAARAQGFDI